MYTYIYIYTLPKSPPGCRAPASPELLVRSPNELTNMYGKHIYIYIHVYIYIYIYYMEISNIHMDVHMYFLITYVLLQNPN